MLTTFPNRVWFETPNGWASRIPDKEDIKRRKRFAQEVLFRKFQIRLTEFSKEPDRELRRGT